MALSPAHQFGQIIGELLESAICPLLENFAKEHNLYLDKHGPRQCRSGKKCRWQDLNGNSHDLDFVLERGGSSTMIGSPVAFIETAWRRYTKHSRNKAQEIQGAILPLVKTYRHTGPFIGVVLAGVFTQGALEQLRSLGFSVLFFPYELVVEAFRRSGINASFDQDTPNAEFDRKVSAFRGLSNRRRTSLSRRLIELNDSEVENFLSALSKAITRRIMRISILPLHGKVTELSTIAEAITFVKAVDESNPIGEIQRYEIQIRYDNGDQIEGRFGTKDSAVGFLNGFTGWNPSHE